MEPFIGQIQAFGFNFAPRGWALCNGQLLDISQNQALFSLLGTMYGGDGRTTFGLPDLRGRTLVGTGQGPGLSPIQQGDRGGTESVHLTVANIPSHTHTVSVGASDSDATSDEPSAGARLGTASSQIYVGGAPVSVSLAADATTATGGNQPFLNREPFLGINYCIALVGIYPSRN